MIIFKLGVYLLVPHRKKFTSKNSDSPTSWGMREEKGKACLKLNIQKTKIMASGSITLWKIEGERVKAVTDFIFLGSRITANSNCSHDIKRHLLLGRKAVTYLVSILKSRDITLQKKVPVVKLWFFQ